jgi:cobalt-zinc-cadmium efflux system protein
MYTTKAVAKDCILVILQSCPASIDIQEIKNEILRKEGVIGINQLHIWSLNPGKNILTVSINIDNSCQSPEQLCIKLKDQLQNKFDIKHSTIEIMSKDGDEEEDGLIIKLAIN